MDLVADMASIRVDLPGSYHSKMVSPRCLMTSAVLCDAFVAARSASNAARLIFDAVGAVTLFGTPSIAANATTALSFRHANEKRFFMCLFSDPGQTTIGFRQK